MPTVLVVGGSGGIGSAIVRRFAREGHSITFTYLRAEQAAGAVVEEARALGGTATAEQLDARDVERIASIVAGCGDELTTVVFAAASGVQRPLADVRMKHCDWTFQTNQRSFVALYQASLAPLAHTQGSLLALTSSGSRRVLPDYALVGASKAAIETLVRYAAYESAAAGIRVNSVCPGLVETKALNSFPEIGRRLRATAGATPLGRLVTPEEVANVVFWLAGDDARMITGHNLVIDGGWELGNSTGPVP